MHCTHVLGGTDSSPLPTIHCSSLMARKAGRSTPSATSCSPPSSEAFRGGGEESCLWACQAPYPPQPRARGPKFSSGASPSPKFEPPAPGARDCRIECCPQHCEPRVVHFYPSNSRTYRTGGPARSSLARPGCSNGLIHTGWTSWAGAGRSGPWGAFSLGSVRIRTMPAMRRACLELRRTLSGSRWELPQGQEGGECYWTCPCRDP